MFEPGKEEGLRKMMSRSMVKGTASSSKGRESRGGEAGGPGRLGSGFPFLPSTRALICLQNLLRAVLLLLLLGQDCVWENNVTFWFSSLHGR